MMAPLVAEVLPVRPYPLDVSTWLGELFRVSAAVMHQLGFTGAPLGSLVHDDDGVVVRLDPPRLRPTWRVLLLPLRLRRLARTGAAETWAGTGPAVDTAAVPGLATAGWAELVDTLRRASVVPPEVIDTRLAHLPDAVSLLWLWLTLRLLHRSDRLGDLVSGTDNRTAQTARALDALADRIRRDPALAHLFRTVEPERLPPVLAQRHPGFLADLQSFLDRYGHRETASPLLASQPTWADEPQVVLGLLRARAAAAPPPAHTRPAWQQARDDLLRHPLLRPPPLRRAVLRWLAASRRAFQGREDSRFLLTRALPLVRGCIRELGHRLWTAGVLARPQDVLHLTVDELAQIRRWPPPRTLAATLRQRVRRRAAARAALAGTPLVDPSWFGPAGPRRRRPDTGPALARGVPGSPGVASGPVRVVRDATEFDRLSPGDVLVTPYTNPAWTPLFDRAAAVVVDTGGAMSHAAIVAREYGIPAVMATVDATGRLADGRPVRVDGTRGLVTSAR